jgi:hypothetical protein
MQSAFGVDHGDNVSKAEKRSSGNPSAGRRATNAAFGIYHTASVSPKGRRAKNIGSDYGSRAAGAVPGLGLYGAGAVKMLGRSGTNSMGKLTHSGKVGAGLAAGGLVATGAGSMAAGQWNMGRLNRAGNLKKEEVGKAFTDEEIAKLAIPKMPSMGNAVKGFKSGLGGWKEGGLGKIGAAGAKVGRGAAYTLQNKKPIGIGTGLAVGGAAAGGGAVAMRPNKPRYA